MEQLSEKEDYYKHLYFELKKKLDVIDGVPVEQKAPTEQSEPVNQVERIDTFLKKYRITKDTEITLSLLIELLDKFSPQSHQVEGEEELWREVIIKCDNIKYLEVYHFDELEKLQISELKKQFHITRK